MPIFCVKSIDRVKISGASGSEDTGISLAEDKTNLNVTFFICHLQGKQVFSPICNKSLPTRVSRRTARLLQETGLHQRGSSQNSELFLSPDEPMKSGSPCPSVQSDTKAWARSLAEGQTGGSALYRLTVPPWLTPPLPNAVNQKSLPIGEGGDAQWCCQEKVTSRQYPRGMLLTVGAAGPVTPQQGERSDITSPKKGSEEARMEVREVGRKRAEQ
ncbi:hypothetical protein NQZ68_026992 [Dissostichus eleginoides]|nr:hypothetical protein NQZ68_026992 [Dissostichus eleginoides]